MRPSGDPVFPGGTRGTRTAKEHTVQKSSIIVLVASAMACGVIALRPDRRPEHQPQVPAAEVVMEASPETLAIADRLAKKDRLIHRLIAGELTLFEATNAVIALNREWPLVPPETYEVYPGRSLETQVAHMLIRASECRFGSDDPRRDVLHNRLTRELGDISVGGRSAAD